MPTAISRRALSSLNSPMRIRTNDDDPEECFDRGLLADSRKTVWRATILWYLPLQHEFQARLFEITRRYLLKDALPVKRNRRGFWAMYEDPDNV